MMFARQVPRAVGGAFLSSSAGVGRQARYHAAVRQLPFFPRLPRGGGSARQPLSRLYVTTGAGLADPLTLSQKRLDAVEAKRDAAETKWANHGEPADGPYYDMLKDAQAAVVSAQANVDATIGALAAEAKRDAAEAKRDAAEAKWANHGEPADGPYYDMLMDARAGRRQQRGEGHRRAYHERQGRARQRLGTR